jgi:hypothetical protein
MRKPPAVDDIGLWVVAHPGAPIGVSVYGDGGQRRSLDGDGSGEAHSYGRKGSKAGIRFGETGASRAASGIWRVIR